MANQPAEKSMASSPASQAIGIPMNKANQGNPRNNERLESHQAVPTPPHGQARQSILGNSITVPAHMCVWVRATPVTAQRHNRGPHINPRSVCHPRNSARAAIECAANNGPEPMANVDVASNFPTKRHEKFAS